MVKKKILQDEWLRRHRMGIRVWPGDARMWCDERESDALERNDHKGDIRTWNILDILQIGLNSFGT